MKRALVNTSLLRSPTRAVISNYFATIKEPLKNEINFELTARQRSMLNQVQLRQNRQSDQDSEENTKFELRGHVNKEGLLVVDNLSIEFMHRWMDCTKPLTTNPNGEQNDKIVEPTTPSKKM